MLSERSQTQKDQHRAIPFTGGPQRSPIHRDRKWVVGPGAGGGEGRECLTGTECQFGTMSKSLEVDGGDCCTFKRAYRTGPHTHKWLGL